MRYVMACALLLACGKQGAKRECDAYAEAFANALRPDPSRRTTVVTAEKHACLKGQVTDDQMACVHAASDESDIRRCMGQGPAIDARVGALSIQSVNGGGLSGAAQTDRQRLWLREFANRLTLCEPKTTVTPPTFEVIATYGSNEQIDVSAVPEDLRDCVARTFRGRRPPDRDVAQFDVPIHFQIAVRQ